jgi:hypothetical protein
MTADQLKELIDSKKQTIFTAPKSAADEPPPPPEPVTPTKKPGYHFSPSKTMQKHIPATRSFTGKKKDLKTTASQLVSNHSSSAPNLHGKKREAASTAVTFKMFLSYLTSLEKNNLIDVEKTKKVPSDAHDHSHTESTLRDLRSIRI